jgi:hypothetical protein
MSDGRHVLPSRGKNTPWDSWDAFLRVFWRRKKTSVGVKDANLCSYLQVSASADPFNIKNLQLTVMIEFGLLEN